MVDTAASIVKLAIELSKIPETVKINRGQCQLLVDRIDALAAHLQRMQSEDMREQLEQTHEEMLVRAHSVVVECEDFMRSFEDGKWITKALKREKHRETFNELHESLTYIFQILHLEIDYQSLRKQSVRAEVADVAHMEEQLSNIASNMEKLENSVTAISEESKRQHNDIMTALKNVRVYRQTMGQDHLSAVVAIARQESMDRKDVTVASCSGIDTKEPSPPPTRGKDLEAGRSTDIPRPRDAATAVGSEARLTPAWPPKPDGKISTTHAVGKKLNNGSTPGPSLHIKPFSQSYGVGLATGVMTGRWLTDAALTNANGTTVGEGGAKRGEYEVSFGEGQMGISLKNVEGRAEVSKVEKGGAAHAAGVRPGDNVSGINGRIPLGYTQVMGSLPTVPRPVKICFIRGQGATLSPGSNVKISHASTWASNAVTAGVSHPAGDKGVLLEIYAKASFSQNPWVRSLGWDSLPFPEGTGKTGMDNDSGEDGADDLSRWSGVRTGRNGKVIEMRLPGNNAHGVLPPSLGSLSELRTVELRENRFEGNIPESLRYLQKLAKVDFSHNLLEGSVPGGDVRWINSMSILLLNNNKLSGHIPSTLGRLVNLTQLDLAYNHLSGTIPSEIATAHALEVLSFANNALTGSIPKSFSRLTKLKLFSASNNKISGSLPQGLGLLMSLEVLSLAHNDISGSISDDCLSSPSLVSVDLSFNKLEGKIPHSVGACLTNLTELDISRNSITGELPSNIGGAFKNAKLLKT
eukprot:g16407.t1